MKTLSLLLTTLTLAISATRVTADDKAASTSDAPAKSKAALKVLYITGGGYHKYDKLLPIILDGIKKHANVDFDVKWDLDCMRDKNLGEGYDAIVYNICFAGDEKKNTLPPQADAELIANALRVTREGKPTVMLHCTMHTFMASDDWTECCGERTRHHDDYEAFDVRKVSDEHPAVKHFPKKWTTPGDELYQTINFPQTSTALLEATSPSPKTDQGGKTSVVCWVHTYGKGPVFGTTLGHDEKTVEKDEYLRLLADGLLWACGKLDNNGDPKPGYGPTN